MSSIALGVGWAALGTPRCCEARCAGPHIDRDHAAGLAIVSMHFTAMGAVVLVPDPTRVAGSLSLSPTSLSLVVAGAAAVILGMCFVAAGGDRRSNHKLQRQKLLLDAALANMSQGLCMFDPDGHIVLFNER